MNTDCLFLTEVVSAGFVGFLLPYIIENNSYSLGLFAAGTSLLFFGIDQFSEGLSLAENGQQMLRGITA